MVQAAGLDSGGSAKRAAMSASKPSAIAVINSATGIALRRAVLGYAMLCRAVSIVVCVLLCSPVHVGLSC
jgi:hypothetical protein